MDGKLNSYTHCEERVINNNQQVYRFINEKQTYSTNKHKAVWGKYDAFT